MNQKSISEDGLGSALPDVDSRLTLAGLDNQITIYRDSYGIPHVKASTAHDAFFGQGFATAQDRLFVMDHDRRWAYGRWAEVAGPSAIDQDILMRKFQLRASVDRDYDAIRTETRNMFCAYAEGVNAFLDTTNALPIEYQLTGTTPEPWQPQDCIAVFKARHVLMGHIEAKLWRAKMVAVLGAEQAAKLWPGTEADSLLVVPVSEKFYGTNYDALEGFSSGAENVDWLADASAGSNNWAVHGSRTASGKPLIAGDPHRPLETPSVYYQNHLACDAFDAVGLSFAGLPGFPHFGHNDKVAWCVTHASADYQDLYIEHLRDDSPSTYEFKGEWHETVVNHEVIGVKGAESVELDVHVTHHGPIILGNPTLGLGVAFKYTATDGASTGLDPLIDQLKSSSAEEMEDAMQQWVDPCNNYVFGDINGDIRYLTRGKVPVRSIENAWLPVPGWDGNHEWDGMIPFEELPRMQNPESGFIVTANNRIVGEDYPYYISIQYSNAYRADRIHDRLTAMTDATVEDMASVHAERISIPALRYISLLDSVQTETPLANHAKEILRGWNGSMDVDEVAPTIFSVLRYFLDDRLLRLQLGDLADEALGVGGRGAPHMVALLKAQISLMAADDNLSLLPTGESWPTVIGRALHQAIEYLQKSLGDDIKLWTWGTIHQTKPKHWLADAIPEKMEVLQATSRPLGGDGDTPLASSYQHGNFDISGTSVARYIYDLNDWDKSLWIVPLGASGHPGSPHFEDQAELWSKMDYIPMLYNWEKIKVQAETSQILSSK